MARLFFAVWPDPACAGALAALAADLAQVAGGNPVPAAKIHLTLVFLGELDAVARARVVEAARGITGAPFAMSLDRVGAFRRARVAWAGPSAPPAALVDLQSELERRVRDAGVAVEERPFAPHVTLARKTTRPVPRASIPGIGWAVREMVLARTEAGTGRYEIEERWGLV